MVPPGPGLVLVGLHPSPWPGLSPHCQRRAPLCPFTLTCSFIDSIHPYLEYYNKGCSIYIPDDIYLWLFESRLELRQSASPPVEIRPMKGKQPSESARPQHLPWRWSSGAGAAQNYLTRSKYEESRKSKQREVCILGNSMIPVQYEKKKEERCFLLFISKPRAAESKPQLPWTRADVLPANFLTRRHGGALGCPAGSRLWSEQRPWEYLLSPHWWEHTVCYVSDHPSFQATETTKQQKSEHLADVRWW